MRIISQLSYLHTLSLFFTVPRGFEIWKKRLFNNSKLIIRENFTWINIWIYFLMILLLGDPKYISKSLNSRFLWFIFISLDFNDKILGCLRRFLPKRVKKIWCLRRQTKSELVNVPITSLIILRKHPSCICFVIITN